MSIKTTVRKSRIPHAKSAIEVINADIEENGWCADNRLLLPNTTLSAMELNLTRLPGIFTFISNNAGHTVDGKYYEIDEKGNYRQIDSSDAKNTQISAMSNKMVVKISATKGQLGPLDFEYFQHVEELLYKYIIDNQQQFTPMKNAQINLGTYCDFIKVVKGKKCLGGSSYGYVENFFHRLTGLTVTYFGKAKYIAKYMVNGNIKERTVSGDYKPFRKFNSDGEVNGNKGIFLEVDADYISNVICGHTKLVYSELINGISQSSSKYLFRYLTIHDKKAIIPLKYSELTQLMGVTRHTKKALALNQIGSFARGINNDKHGNLLVYASTNDDAMFGKKFPFIMKKMNNKHDWQFLFFLNVFVTPDMHNYGVQSIALDIIKNKKKRLNEIYETICGLAERVNMSVKDYLENGLTGVSLARALGVSEHETEEMKKRNMRKVTHEAIAGRKLLKLAGGLEQSNKLLREIENKKRLNSLEQESLKEQERIEKLSVVVSEKRRRGRPICDGIPF